MAGHRKKISGADLKAVSKAKKRKTAKKRK